MPWPLHDQRHPPAGTSWGIACLLESLTDTRVDMMAGAGSTREGVAASVASETPSSDAPVSVIAALVGTLGPVGSSIAETATQSTSRPAKTIGVPQLLILTIISNCEPVKFWCWVKAPTLCSCLEAPRSGHWHGGTSHSR